MTLDEILVTLLQYGDPTISYHSGYNSGFTCRVDLKTTIPGASGVMRSEFGHTYPMDAALECLERCINFVGRARIGE